MPNTPIRVTKILNSDRPNVNKKCGKTEAHKLLVGMPIGPTLWNSISHYFLKVNICLSLNLVVQLLIIYPRDTADLPCHESKASQCHGAPASVGT